MRNTGVKILSLLLGALLCAASLPAQSPSLKSLTVADGLPHDEVLSLHQARTGYLWLGTRAGAGYWDGFSFTPVTAEPHIEPAAVYSLVEDFAGQIYCGTARGVLVYQAGRLANLAAGAEGVATQVHALYCTQDGQIYVAAEEGAFVLRGNRLLRFASRDSLPLEHAVALGEDARGALYIGTRDRGIWRLQATQLELLIPPSAATLTALLPPQPLQETLFYGTEQGLRRGHTLAHTAEGIGAFPKVSIRSLIQEDQHGLYLGTSSGIYHCSFAGGSIGAPAVLGASAPSTLACNAGAVCQDRQGRIWFGTMQGAVCLDPAPERSAGLPPLVQVTQVRRFDHEMPLRPLSQNLVVQNLKNYLEIDFIGIDLLAPTQVSYRYRLEGVDRDWQESKQRHAQYQGLTEGDYLFEIQARGEHSGWSEPTRVPFTIAPPFWERLWFISFLTLLIAGSAFYFVSVRVRQLLSLERLRTRIAADLHDNIGAGLTEIAVLSEVSAQRLEAHQPAQVLAPLKKIGRISRLLVDGMNDIVWLVNPRRDSLYDLLLQLVNSYSDILSSSGIVFRVENLEILKNVHLPMNYRQQLFAIFKEGLNNSLKHSQAREVVLQAQLKRRHLYMRLHDDGRGFDTTVRVRGNGVANMKDRAQLLGGLLRLVSAPGQGTALEFEGNIPTLLFGTRS